MRACTIDIGTNSVRALVADVDQAGHIHVVLREGQITRLGERLSSQGFLDEGAIERTARAVETIVRKARGLKTDQFKVVATSAAREASNSDRLRDRIRALTSLDVEVIPGVDEARYVCLGALGFAELHGRTVLMADIGGGSTELILARHGEEPILRSVNVGAVDVTERFLHSDPPLAAELTRARQHIKTNLRETYRKIPRGAEELIVLGGTITTVPPILLEMEVYDPSKVHGYELSSEEVRSLRRRLASLPLERRVAVKGLEPARGDIIVGGLLVVEVLLELTGCEKLRVSDRGILFGLALSIHSAHR